MAIHRIMMADLGPNAREGAVVAIAGPEARHAARAKRLAVGDRVEVMDGQGLVVVGLVQNVDRSGRGETGLNVLLTEVQRVEPASPRLWVYAPAPKGNRLDQMIEGLSQVGAAGWRPIVTERTVVEPRPTKLDRLRRIAEEAAKQSGRAWVLQIAEPQPMPEALKQAPGRVIMADAEGEDGEQAREPAEDVSLFVGPEGGWSADERTLWAQQRGSAGVLSRCYGLHVMRVETAAVVAAGVELYQRSVVRLD